MFENLRIGFRVAIRSALPAISRAARRQQRMECFKIGRRKVSAGGTAPRTRATSASAPFAASVMPRGPRLAAAEGDFERFRVPRDRPRLAGTPALSRRPRS